VRIINLEGWLSCPSASFLLVHFDSVDHLSHTVRAKNKKADVAEHPKVFDHVGLLTNEPLGKAGLLFI
jgi:hypothetical protein